MSMREKRRGRARTATRPDQTSCGGCQQIQHSPDGAGSQGWNLARSLESESIQRARAALAMRGADRFNALALASAYALAACGHALMAGGVA